MVLVSFASFGKSTLYDVTTILLHVTFEALVEPIRRDVIMIASWFAYRPS